MRRSSPVLVSVLALMLALAGCSQTKDTGFPAPKPESPSPTAEETSSGNEPVELNGQPIHVVDSAYEPKIAKVKAGTEIVWQQTGTAPHSVTADDGRFNSHPQCPPGCMSTGDEFKATFDKPGEYTYYCVIHAAKGSFPANMTGKIIVE